MGPSPGEPQSPTRRGQVRVFGGEPSLKTASCDRKTDQTPDFAVLGGSSPAGFLRSTLGLALAGGLLVWAALPPLGIGVLAWPGLTCWVLLARQATLSGRRPYRTLYFVGFAFWMAVLHWLRLPYWATCFGWVALSAYLACYLPAFVGLTRIAVQRCHTPLIVAAPVVWTGLELARAHLLSGFRMAAVGHSQYRFLTLIQVSDLAGDYAVDFLMLFVAACLARMVPVDSQRRMAVWPLAPAALAIGLALFYGVQRMQGPSGEKLARVALIQGSIDTEMKADPAQDEAIHQQYLDLSRQALAAGGQVDLIVWPETMFRKTYLTADSQPATPLDWPHSTEDFRAALSGAMRRSLDEMRDLVRSLGTATVLGVDRQHFGADRMYRYNAAVLFSAAGELLASYDKMHPVMFGEYMPFSRYFPWLKHLTPVSMNLDSGEGPAAFAAGKGRFCPSVCYETVLAHLIRSQVTTLQRSGVEPDALVNLTNDGWFWGSSELDLHLICGVFRAIECRKPLLIAANTGFSAWIDGDGRIRAQGPRRDTGYLLADVQRDRRQSPYLAYGDLPAGLCLVGCIVLALAELIARQRAKKPAAAALRK